MTDLAVEGRRGGKDACLFLLVAYSSVLWPSGARDKESNREREEGTCEMKKRGKRRRAREISNSSVTDERRERNK